MFATLPATSLLADEQQHYCYRDSQSRPLRENSANTDQLIGAFLDAPPGWIERLMQLRDRVVKPLGLKTAPPHQPPRAPFFVGQQIGVFRVFNLASSEVILGEDDRHLNFRVSLLVDRNKLCVSTLVRPHNALGTAYLCCVLPFHHLIVTAMIGRMAKHLDRDARA